VKLQESRLNTKLGLKEITMTVTDGDRFAVAMAKLSQARSAVYEATRIIEHLFEADEFHAKLEDVCLDGPSCSDLDPDPVTGLYPGQKPDTELVCEQEEDVECLE
jgi:hypothetical protein